ncbi:MAG: hypothetical protein JXB85_09405 [Anaerolineales bacterium]|nr:hypothetical protein [Anaerolineales bacterium]
MNNVTHIVQNVRQAPWRIQRQWIGLFLLVLVLSAMVAGIYLNVTAQAALAGRAIQLLKDEISDNQRINADLETQLADLTSTEAMEARALALGFRPVQPEDITYVVVPGYVPKSPVDMSDETEHTFDSPLTPEYTQSLFDWLVERLTTPSGVTGGPR